MVLPNQPPIFTDILHNITIDITDPLSIRSYQFPDVYEVNNDTYTITVNDIPQFVTFNE